MEATETPAPPPRYRTFPGEVPGAEKVSLGDVFCVYDNAIHPVRTQPPTNVWLAERLMPGNGKPMIWARLLLDCEP